MVTHINQGDCHDLLCRTRRITALDVEITQVGLEAGTLTQYLTYGLRFAGYGVVCMEPRQVKAALSAMRNKTDKNDARGIAQLLRSGWLPPVPTA